MFLDVANRSVVLLLSGGILGEASVEQCLSRTLGSDFTRNNQGGLVEGGFFVCVCVYLTWLRDANRRPAIQRRSLTGKLHCQEVLLCHRCR